MVPTYLVIWSNMTRDFNMETSDIWLSIGEVNTEIKKWLGLTYLFDFCYTSFFTLRSYFQW